MGTITGATHRHQRRRGSGCAGWLVGVVLVQLYIYVTIGRMEIVIDTSALLAVVAMEPERAELIRLSKGATLVAPSSVHWEIGNALSAMFKRKAIELDDALKVIDGYAGIPIRLIDPSLRQAVQLCRELNLYAYDAYVIACAINQRAPILSLDNVLKERARSLKLDVLEVNPS
jgi:predicted nucleic acid-binding protein